MCYTKSTGGAGAEKRGDGISTFTLKVKIGATQRDIRENEPADPEGLQKAVCDFLHKALLFVSA